MRFKASIQKKISKFEKMSSFKGAMKELERQTNGLIALEIRNAAIKLLNDNKDGTKATRYMPRRNVFVSNPGDAPNTDTGRLVQSIKVERDGESAYLVGTNLKYGAWLEFGTKDMAARPWLSTALRLTGKNLSKITQDAYANFMENFFK